MEPRRSAAVERVLTPNGIRVGRDPLRGECDLVLEEATLRMQTAVKTKESEPGGTEGDQEFDSRDNRNDRRTPGRSSTIFIPIIERQRHFKRKPREAADETEERVLRTPLAFSRLH